MEVAKEAPQDYEAFYAQRPLAQRTPRERSWWCALTARASP